MLKRTKKFAALVLTGALFTTVLVGCGSKTESKSNEKIELTWMGFGQPQEKEVYDKVIKNFEAKYPNVKVKFVATTQDQYGTKIQAAMASNTLPDVFYASATDIRPWVNSDKLLNMTPYIEKQSDIKVESVWKKGLDKYRYDGKTSGAGDIYAMPKDVGPFGFAYNKTMFEKAGIPLPDKDKPYTWQEWVDICKKLTKDTNGDGKNDQFGTGLNINWTLQSFVWSNGGDWLDSSKTKITITDPKFVEALQFFADQTLKEKITPDAAQAQTLDTYQRWLKGELAFFPCAPWDVAAFKDLKFEYDLLPWPVGSTGKPATWMGSVGFAVSKTSKHPQEAVNFAMYLSADKDANQYVSDHQIQVPNIVDMAKNNYVKTEGKPANKEEFLQIIEDTDYGRALPAEYTYNAEWYNKFFEGIDSVLQGKKTAQQYCEEKQPVMQQLLDKAIEKEKKETKK